MNCTEKFGDNEKSRNFASTFGWKAKADGDADAEFLGDHQGRYAAEMQGEAPTLRTPYLERKVAY